MTAFAFPRLTAAVLAGAVALTGITATPASAMNDRDRAALGLILGLGVLAAVADDSNDRRPPPRRAPQPERYRDHDHRRAEACTVRVYHDRHGRRIEEMSPGCNDRGRDRRRGPDDWRGDRDDWRHRH